MTERSQNGSRPVRLVFELARADNPRLYVWGYAGG